MLILMPRLFMYCLANVILRPLVYTNHANALSQVIAQPKILAFNMEKKISS